MFDQRKFDARDKDLKKIRRTSNFTRIVNFQQGNCWFCGIKMGADCTREHLLARARGGDDSEGNIKAAHSECNSAAGSLSVAKKYKLREIAHTEGRGEMLMMAKRMRRADARAAFSKLPAK